MILKKLIELIAIFDKAELKKFERFIRSSYFNTNEHVYKLFKCLRKFYPGFDDKRLNNKYLFKEIYGQKRLNDKTLRYLLSELRRLAEKYLAISAVEKDKNEMRKRLIENLIFKNLFAQTYSHLKANDKELFENFTVSGPAIDQAFRNSLAWHQVTFFSGNLDPLFEKRIREGEYLSFYSIIELCHIYQNLMTLKLIYNAELEDNIFFAFVRNIDYRGVYSRLKVLEKSYRKDKHKNMLIKTFKIYICFMITFLDLRDEEYFFKTKEMVGKYHTFFSRDELRDLHTMLMNCAANKRKAIDDKKYLKELFELIKSGLLLNLYSAYYDRQYMEVTAFDKIFTTALALREFSWADSFIKQYSKELPPEFREDLFNYSGAELAFTKQEYERALELLSKVSSFKYFSLKTKVKNLTLMIYYELNHIDEAISLMTTYHYFLKTNKQLPPEQRESNLNFLNFAKEILKSRENSVNSAGAELLLKDVSNCRQVSNKTWLLEKVKEFKKG